MKDKFDKNLSFNNTSFDESLKIYDVTKPPFVLYGNCKEAKNIFARMNEKDAGKISSAVKDRGERCAGVRLRFKTNSKRLGLKVMLYTAHHFPSQTAISSKGFDVYADGKYVNSVFPDDNEKTKYEQIINFDNEKTKDIIIYFPYNAVVENLYLGIDKDASVSPGEEYVDLPPIVFYGSSITHGFSVSRPGIAFTSMISRDLDIDYVNLGFSGAAKGELSMAEYLASLNKSLIVCEYDHNEPTVEELAKKHLPFYKRFREIDKETPILFISKPDEQDSVKAKERMEIIKRTYLYAMEKGDKNVYFIDGLSLFPDDIRYDCTVDAIHPNDLGAYMIAQKLSPEIRKILCK